MQVHRGEEKKVVNLFFLQAIFNRAHSLGNTWKMPRMMETRISLMIQLGVIKS